MKNYQHFLILLFTPFLNLALSGESTEPVTPEDIVQRHLANQASDLELVLFEMTRTVKGNSMQTYQVLAAYHAFENGSRGYLLRVLQPKEVAGSAVLMRDNPYGQPRQYVYLPELGKPKRLRRESEPISFLGTDFTYDDLLREVPSTQQYERMEDVRVGDQLCYVVRAKDRFQQTWKAYHHRDLYITHQDARLVKIEFYKNEEALLKTLYLSDFKSPANESGPSIPHRGVMLLSSMDSQTELKVQSYIGGIGLGEDFFTPSSLQQFSPEQAQELLDKLP